MRFTTSTFVAFMLTVAPVLSTPIPDDNIMRATTVTCKPQKNDSPTKSFKVDVDTATAQAKKALFKTGESGDPHKYNGGDGIKWGVQNCDAKDAILMEYPVYWTGAKAKEWQKDVKSSKQDKTPIRVVYANKNGSPIYCGVMTHSEVTKDYQGKKFFQKCD